jgi:hypothetical protein
VLPIKGGIGSGSGAVGLSIVPVACVIASSYER